MMQERLDFSAGKKEAVPKVGLLVWGKISPIDCSLYFLPGLKPWLFNGLRKTEPSFWKRVRQNTSRDRPVPDGRQSAKLFLDGRRADGTAAKTRLLGSAVDVGLKVVELQRVNRQDDQPIYNTRFLSFATHYGYRPWACRPRRPQTKGKVERPFHYVETSLLNGRSFRSLEHLNEVTRWWLANVADVRNHRTTKKRPLDAHAEELPHLLPLPECDYDTARVVYRIVDVEGLVSYTNNQYSAPWQLVGELLPVRVTEKELFVYDQQIRQLARHSLFIGQAGQQRIDPSHRPPRDHREQLSVLRGRFAELGEVASRFLEGLLKKQRCGKRQAGRVLLLLQAYQREDVLTAMNRAVRYHAYSLSSLERILAMQASPKVSWKSLGQDDQETLWKSYVFMTGLLRDKKTAIGRLRKLLFGSQTEKTDAVVGSSSEPARRHLREILGAVEARPSLVTCGGRCQV